MRKSTFFICLSALLFAVSCETNDRPDDTHPVNKEALSGFVQKGPFINGSSITVSELNSELIQTGNNFSTQISDNTGKFELRDLALSSQYVEMKADGFYFNEIQGNMSTARLILYALTDLTDKNNLNVNILSHLEKGRISYLVSKGSEFSEAKKTAEGEILGIFSIHVPAMNESVLLDISKEGDDNGVLLAISVIIQGFRTDAELSELLANIATDIREDGVLNSASTGTDLINHAMLLNLPLIRENLEKRYEAMGMEASIPDFEKYVQMFLDSTSFQFTSLIEYPEYSDYGENILYGDKTDFVPDVNYSLAATLPVGAELKIVLSGGLWYYRALPNGPVNWKISQYDFGNKTQSFTAIESGKSCDLSIQFAPPFYENGEDSTEVKEGVMNDTITIEYFENNLDTPARTKTIVFDLPEDP